MRLFLSRLTLLTILTLGLGFCLNMAFAFIRYNYTLKNFLCLSEKTNLIIGSSRVYHNINDTALDSSFQVISKPNLYGIDVYNILKHIPVQQKQLFLEYQQSGFSSDINCLIFWDAKELFQYIRLTQNLDDANVIFVNTFLLKDMIIQLKGFDLPPKVLHSDSKEYPEMVKQTPPEIKLQIVHFLSDSIKYSCSRSFFKCDLPNNNIYSAINRLYSTKTPILLYPFGHYNALAVALNTKPHINNPVIDLTQLNYDTSEIYDYRHLKSVGSIKMTRSFNIQAASLLSKDSKHP